VADHQYMYIPMYIQQSCLAGLCAFLSLIPFVYCLRVEISLVVVRGWNRESEPLGMNHNTTRTSSAMRRVPIDRSEVHMGASRKARKLNPSKATLTVRDADISIFACAAFDTYRSGAAFDTYIPFSCNLKSVCMYRVF
jgi:hypothetical protein